MSYNQTILKEYESTRKLNTGIFNLKNQQISLKGQGCNKSVNRRVIKIITCRIKDNYLSPSSFDIR